MSTPATYKIHDWIEDVDSDLFLYVAGDNTPQKAAVKFRNMLNMYHATYDQSPADAFIAAERTSPFKFSFRHNHEQDADTAYHYSLEFSLHTQSFFLTAEIVQRRWWRKKPFIRPFFRGSVEEFIQRYSSSPSLVTGVYKIQDEKSQGEVCFYSDHGNTPQEAAFKLALMHGLHQATHSAYSEAFSQAHQDAEIEDRPSEVSDTSDYLYTLKPFTDEEGWEGFILKAYADGNNHRLFFEGCLEDFIKIFGKN